MPAGGTTSSLDWQRWLQAAIPVRIPGSSGPTGDEARAVASQEERRMMPKTVVTPSPGFISLAVLDVHRSARFYERYLGAIRDTFDFGPDSAVFVCLPTVGPS